MNRLNQRKISNLRTNSFVALVLVLIEVGIGVGVNLFATLPANDASKSVFESFAKAVVSGPIMLIVHALLGTLVIISGITAVVSALLSHRAAPIVLSSIAILSIIVAWLSGSKFVSIQNNGASMAMAITSIVASLCYAVILFVLPTTPRTADTNQ